MTEQANILVVDDQPELLDALRFALEFAGHNVTTAPDGHSALNILQEQPVDLVISDIAMPVINGYQFFQRVRDNADWDAIPFLFLTARGMDSDVRYGKELGADDYLIKPIEADDLIAAVNGKLRRSRQFRRTTTKSSSRMVVGPFVLDSEQHRVWRDGEPISLAAREFIVFERLMQRPETVISTRELILATHDLNTDDEEASTLLRPLIRSLRRKLGYGIGEQGCIENVRAIGYRLTNV